MSDLDNSTNKNIADGLKELNIRLSTENKIHGYEDALLLQAIKRLNDDEATPMTSNSRRLFETLIAIQEEQSAINLNIIERVNKIESRFGRCFLDNTPVYDRLDEMKDTISMIERNIEDLQRK